MDKFVGQHVQNITLKKQSDVIIQKILAVEGIVTIPDGVEALEAGQVLFTPDGGKNFIVAADDAKSNAVLCNAITETCSTEALLVGKVKEKYLEGFKEAHREHLFNNKIILK